MQKAVFLAKKESTLVVRSIVQLSLPANKVISGVRKTNKKRFLRKKNKDASAKNQL